MTVKKLLILCIACILCAGLFAGSAAAADASLIEHNAAEAALEDVSPASGDMPAFLADAAIQAQAVPDSVSASLPEPMQSLINAFKELFKAFNLTSNSSAAVSAAAAGNYQIGHEDYGILELTAVGCLCNILIDDMFQGTLEIYETKEYEILEGEHILTVEELLYPGKVVRVLEYPITMEAGGHISKLL
ncbi:MAG TPA: hypothetical protein O0X70_03855 [Methanocorpusculum sp.]|nr:hypothetical protein [Methanocorpusculum sp.]